jgi:DNA-binding beta-propeller fold protein YncE
VQPVPLCCNGCRPDWGSARSVVHGAECAQDTIAIIDWRAETVADRIVSEDGPSKVVFSPDGKLAYVNHLRASALDVIDVAARKIVVANVVIVFCGVNARVVNSTLRSP